MNKLVGLMIIFSVVSTAKVYAEGTPCEVGMRRPDGGYVFFCDDPNNPKLTGGKIGLEVEPSDEIGYFFWTNNSMTETGATKIGVGQGLWDTNKIVASCGNSGDEYAVHRCYSKNDHKDKKRDVNEDWFLPSKVELKLVYQNLASQGIGNFSRDSSGYWSSSAKSSSGPIVRDLAWIQYFDNGQGEWNRTTEAGHAVRCAKAF